jgi:hypothetical protein
MEGIADAYVQWELRSSAEGLGAPVGLPVDAMVQNHLPTMVVDLFSKPPSVFSSLNPPIDLSMQVRA